LSPAPADFKAQCRDLRPSGPNIGAKLQFLASFRLTALQSLEIARASARLRTAGADLSPLSGLRLGILASGTIDPLLDCIPAAAARHGIAVELVGTPYDQVLQQALDPASEINRAGLDAVLVAVDHRWLHLDHADLSGASEARVASAIRNLRSVVDGLRENGRTAAILPTLPTPPRPLFGSFDRRLRGTVRAIIDEANRAIIGLAEETGSYLLDVSALAERVGTDQWFDPVRWCTYKLPFAAECVPAYADLLGRLLGAIRGKARKCLVLDLDNTIWGGVIGDDGLEGIHIGHGHPLGEAFLSVQQTAAELRQRGIILAVCSRNTDAVARQPFREHPEMLLQEDHIAVFQANWLDKPSNLEAIANRLNIGVDSLVLLDDNPAERAHVRAALPMVAVPELPDDPSWFPWYLTAAGYFEAVSYSAEDRLRAESYAADSRRAEVMAQARDLGDYLSSLAMVITFAPFDESGRRRITQLINKTNQFNLTTRRCTEAEIAAMERDDSLFTLQVRLADRFGDLGMIAVVICRPCGSDGEYAWDIDTWLMSCRVLGRQVEEAMLARIVAAARAHDVKRLIGTYIPTPKNGMVGDHYLKLGFTPIDQSASAQRFVLSVAAFEPPVLSFTVIDRFADHDNTLLVDRNPAAAVALLPAAPPASPLLGTGS
jgi:FkbH-like protein